MPRHHSVEALDRRRARALERGYVVVKPRPGRRFIECDEHVADRGHVMLKSLEVHQQHELVSGRHHHHARLASRDVADVIGAAAAAEALPPRCRTSEAHRPTSP